MKILSDQIAFNIAKKTFSRLGLRRFISQKTLNRETKKRACSCSLNGAISETDTVCIFSLNYPTLAIMYRFYKRFQTADL